ncbi:hypothetical protein Dda_9223 [Drechslerella dactyloides]|uniref:Uncharacterized protein n=1 Tax=Drechslerella dactyloides TaxID=74499 RepID=A0AAD6IPN0_DREDA|nr:hypothetical protein Dda_9223 [Drechslerella dactyloides]
MKKTTTPTKRLKPTQEKEKPIGDEDDGAVEADQRPRGNRIDSRKSQSEQKSFRPLGCNIHAAWVCGLKGKRTRAKMLVHSGEADRSSEGGW